MGDSTRTKFSDRVFALCAWLSGAAVVATVAVLVGFLLARGLRSIDLHFFFGDTPWMDALANRRPVFDGIWPAIVGTILLILISCGTAIPIGVASGVYLAEYAPRRLRTVFGFTVSLLAGAPSIVMGLFGFTVILALRRTVLPQAQTGLFVAALCIALLILPYVIRTTESALMAIPEHLRLLGPSLGLTKWQQIRSILLPLASRGILSGSILAMGRAAEDTAVILLTGVVAHASIPQGPWDRFEALPFHIYFIAAEHRNTTELEQGFGTALVLLAITGLFLGISIWLERSLKKQWKTK